MPPSALPRQSFGTQPQPAIAHSQLAFMPQIPQVGDAAETVSQ